MASGQKRSLVTSNAASCATRITDFNAEPTRQAHAICQEESMQATQATNKPGDTGPQVANLYAALKFLIDKDAFSFFDLSELNPLKDQLRSEAPSGFYKGAAVKLMV